MADPEITSRLEKLLVLYRRELVNLTEKQQQYVYPLEWMKGSWVTCHQVRLFMEHIYHETRLNQLRPTEPLTAPINSPMRNPFLQPGLNKCSYGDRSSNIPSRPSTNIFHHLQGNNMIKSPPNTLKNSSSNIIRCPARLNYRVEQLSLLPLSFLNPETSGCQLNDSIGTCITRMARVRRQTEVERLRFILRQLLIGWESWPVDQRATFDEIIYMTSEPPARRRDSTRITEGKAYFYIGERFGLGALFYKGLRRAGLQRPFRSYEAEGDFGQYMSTLANNGLQDFSNQLAKSAIVIATAIESWFKWHGLANREKEKATAEKDRAERLYHQSHKHATLLSSSQAFSTSPTGHHITQQPPYNPPLLSFSQKYDNSLSTTTFQPTQGRIKQAYQPLEAAHLRPLESKESSNDGEMSIHSTINTKKLPELRSNRTLPSILPAQRVDAFTDDYRKSEIPVADIELLLSLSDAV